eukprot:NODE_160_length_16633_cov_0.230132.p4 type:complete len:341 gc:universal NODE_160_length_16633_cov_0.230132:9500-8478(-)
MTAKNPSKPNNLHIVGIACIGQPGAGKSSLCNSLALYFQQTNLNSLLVNLDPAHPYSSCDINIRDFIMSERIDGLGPNGSMVKCMDEIGRNISWLTSSIDAHIQGLTLSKDEENVVFIVFDFPGQVELYMHHESTRSIMSDLEKMMRLVVVSVSDSTYLPDFHHFIAMSLTSLGSMLNIGCPTINVLSKMDLLDTNRLQGKLRDYLYPRDLCNMLPDIQSQENNIFFKFQNLSKQLCEIIENYSIISYIPYSIKSPLSIQRLLRQIFKVSGVDCLFSDQYYTQFEDEDFSERWEHKEEYDKWEQEKLEAALDKDQLEAWKKQDTIVEGTSFDPKIFDNVN